jgi:mRNA-degrading endonuclease RelE of RelBE toxin-antitoxin system
VTDEPYRVEVTATAHRCLRWLPEKIVGACVEFIAGPLAANSHRLGKPLERELAGHFSARRKPTSTATPASRGHWLPSCALAHAR